MRAAGRVFLNRFGVITITGVVVDTFVVRTRTVLVPIVLFLGGGLNWWPGQMPEPIRAGEAATAGEAGGELAGVGKDAPPPADEAACGCAWCSGR